MIQKIQLREVLFIIRDQLIVIYSSYKTVLLLWQSETKLEIGLVHN